MRRLERTLRFGILASAISLLGFGVSGWWFSSGYCHHCFHIPNPPPGTFQSVGPQALPFSGGGVIVVAVLLGAITLVVTRHRAVGTLVTIFGFVIVALPYVHFRQLWVSLPTGFRVALAPWGLSVHAYAFVAAGLLFVVLGGILVTAWRERNVPAASESQNPPIVT